MAINRHKSEEIVIKARQVVACDAINDALAFGVENKLNTIVSGSIELEKPGLFRAKSGPNEHAERHENGTGPPDGDIQIISPACSHLTTLATIDQSAPRDGKTAQNTE